MQVARHGPTHKGADPITGGCVFAGDLRCFSAPALSGQALKAIKFSCHQQPKTGFRAMCRIASGTTRTVVKVRFTKDRNRPGAVDDFCKKQPLNVKDQRAAKPSAAAKGWAARCRRMTSDLNQCRTLLLRQPSLACPIFEYQFDKAARLKKFVRDGFCLGVSGCRRE